MKTIITITSLFILAISTQAQWTQIGADIDGEALGDFSGRAVSLNANGTIVAISAVQNDGNGMGSGHVRVFENESDNWVQIGQDIDGEYAGDESGYSLSLNSSGSVLAIGARSNDDAGYNAGHVRIYQNSGGTWTQLGDDIDGESIGDGSGESISLNYDGTVIAIGAELSDGNGDQSGQVRVFSYIDENWIQIGNTLIGEGSSERFGHSLCLNDDGTVLAVGAPGFSDEGTVYVYELSDDEWMQSGTKIVGNGSELSLNADGSILAVAQSTINSETGRVVMYEYNSDEWLQLGNELVGEAIGDLFGTSVDISADGTTIAAGAQFNDGNGENSGHVRVFKFLNGVWTQTGDDIDGENSGDQSGISVSLSADGSVIAVGAPWNAENGLNAGHVRIYENTTSINTGQIEQNNIVVFPNPTNDIINIEFGNKALTNITILNIQGKALYRLSKPQNNGNSIQITLADYNTGIYILKVETPITSFRTKVFKK
ncbi:MAG: T9SS type A sorting domain-containing protein [Bacteroidales bacterium]|nr:T9SS type A sorting domain-containing protein [Bacteroidales bacterium]